MNKARVEAFTDAVVAIILTIMILEFKTPSSLAFSAIFENGPYLISYVVGYVFVGVAWYNHHYLFAVSKRITKRVYWLNNFWLFSMSFIPVATAWVGQGLNAFGPEAFYAIVYFLWTLSYPLLTLALLSTSRQAGDTKAVKAISAMPLYRFLTTWYWVLGLVLVDVIALVMMPSLQLLVVAGLVVFVGARTNSDSDQLFN